MKLSIILVPALLHAVSAHYTFSRLLINNTDLEAWKYVRYVDNDPTGPDSDDWYKNYPQTGEVIYGTNITCGRNAFKYASKTETATIVAGSSVGFRLNTTYPDGGWGEQPSGYRIAHYGPGQVYLAKAPMDDLKTFHGKEGDWFKIAYMGPKNDTWWSLRYLKDANFTIPRTTPPGKYLMRIEQTWPLDSPSQTQWYINCAHVEIIGPGGGKPTNFAKFPGTYKLTDPGLSRPDAKNVQGLLDYVPAGPAVWSG